MSRLANLEALLKSVGADLETYHAAGIDLPEDEMRTLISSVTDRIPEPSCPLQLAAITRAITAWQDGEWLSGDAAAGLRSRMAKALVEANKSRAVAEAAAASAAPLAAVASGAQPVPESSAGSGAGARGKPGSGKGSVSSIAGALPGLEPGQRSIASMMGPKMMGRTLRAADGSKFRQEFEVVNFPKQPPLLKPKLTYPCSFGCGEVCDSVQGRIAHEAFRHHGRDGIKANGPPSDFFTRKDVPPEIIKGAVDSLIELVELTEGMSAEMRDAAVRERIAQREADAADAARAAAAATKAARLAREREREALLRERDAAGGGRRGEPKRHQHTIRDKVGYIELYDRLCADVSVVNKGEAFHKQTGVSATCVLKWAKTENRRRIYRAGELL